jgi:hypothetical protein
MSKQTINIGASPNDGTGTPLRTSFDYCNQNFTELYTATGPSGNNIVVPGNATITGDLTAGTTTLVAHAAGYTGKVGIGTATPAHTLQVQAASGNIMSFTDGTTPGSLYSGGGYAGFTIPAASSGFFINPAGNFATISTNGVENVRVESAGNLKVNYGNLIIGTSGKGIDFSATANSSGTMTSELLNDYEEGTFTPTVTAQAGIPVTTTVNTASYTKIGRVVVVQIDISIVAAGTASSSLIFSLPFTQGTDAQTGALRDVGATAYMGQIFYTAPTTAGMALYDNATVWVNGRRVRGTYTYNV